MIDDTINSTWCFCFQHTLVCFLILGCLLKSEETHSQTRLHACLPLPPPPRSPVTPCPLPVLAVAGAQETPVLPVFSEEPYQTVTGDVSLKLQKMAVAAGLSDGQIDAAGRAAALTANEALRKPGVLPPASPIELSPSCDLVVQGLPQIGSRQQRCCKALDVPMGQGGMAQGLGGARSAGGVQREGGEGGEGGQLPGVLEAQRTRGSGGTEAVCFPSFIIAGTQKSGTTALTGEL